MNWYQVRILLQCSHTLYIVLSFFVNVLPLAYQTTNNVECLASSVQSAFKANSPRTLVSGVETVIFDSDMHFVYKTDTYTPFITTTCTQLLIFQRIEHTQREIHI